MKSRLVYVDTAKAIGIFLVCLGHFLPSGTMIRVAIYSFHVPLFFFVAGVLHSTPIATFQQYFNKLNIMFVRTVIPYAIWFLLSLVVHLAVNPLNVGWLVRAFLYIEGETLWNTPLWFLPCYFLVVTIFRLIILNIGVKRGRAFLCCALAFVWAILLDKFGISISYFGLDKGIHMLGYVLLGYLCSGMIKKQIEREKTVFQYLALFMLFFLVTGIINRGDNISVFNLDYNEIRVFIPIACILCISFLISCALIPQSYAVRLLSKNTCFIMVSHYYALYVIRKCCGTFSICSGILWTLVLFAGYICLLTFLDKKIVSPKCRYCLMYAGIQLSDE